MIQLGKPDEKKRREGGMDGERTGDRAGVESC